MASQLQKLFVSCTPYGNFSTSSCLPGMLQCRTFQSYPGTLLQISPFGIVGTYSKCSQLKIRKEGVGSSISTGVLKKHMFKLGQGSLLPRSYGKSREATFQTNLQVPFLFSVKNSSLYACNRIERNVSSNLFSQECVGGRFFSARPLENSKFKKKKPTKVTGNATVGDEKIGGDKIPPKLSDCFRKPAKSRGVRSSSSNRQVVVRNQPVKNDALGATESVPKTPKPKGEKKDVKSETQVPASSKSSGNIKGPQAKQKKKQPGNKQGKRLSGPAVTPCNAKINGSDKASHAKKINGTENASQASEILPAGDTAMSKIEKSTKRVGKTTTKKDKHKKKVIVHMKPDKAPSNSKKNAEVVEVNKRPLKKGSRSLYPPTSKSVVVVESLTKAKIIQRYLGDMFEVLPSHGHVRDLAGRSGSVRPDDDFSMVWEVPSTAWTHLKSIKVALNGAENLILASDPDREGEAIAWHIIEMLEQQDALHDGINVSRVVFHEITEPSIKSALQNPRDIDADLVHAYLARRALDYLIGFSISPLLWRKLPSCQSAGRVQSSALALICDREMEIDEFKPQEYWTVGVEFSKTEHVSSAKDYFFSSHLTILDCKKLEQLSISSCEEANAVEKKMISSNFEVSGTRRSKIRRNPPIPYITSSLQQDAANKLQFSASYTMKLAQKLYEGVKLANDEATGLITYMRTDGLHVSDAAANDIRFLVIERYGQSFAPESTRKYFKKVKNAQEAHEAIRPTNIRRLPSMLNGVLDEDLLKLYTLIWCRTVACQMGPTVIDQIQVDITGTGSSLGLRSTCSRVDFFGYQAVYKDPEAAAIGNNEKDEDACDEAFEVLSSLKARDSLHLGKVELKQHFTQPPSRYSEGSLVKKLEELGIGRPSTYASTIKVLKDRNYLTVKSRTLHPEFRGRMVSAFLSHHFSEVTDYSFTADMETELDNVSAGITEWKGLLKDYWTRFKTYCDRAGKVDIHQVEKMLEKTFGDFLFASFPDQNRTCPSCLTGSLIFKVSRFGAGYFIGCDQHPKCKYIAKTIYGGDDDDDDGEDSRKEITSEPKVLGLHPTSNEKIFLKNGPYGLYVQLGEDRKGYSPKRASASLIKDPSAITLEDALDLLQYPLLLGNHPEDEGPIYLKIAQHGFSVRHRRTIAPVPRNLDPKKITLQKALKLLVSKDAKRCGRPKSKPKLEEAVGAV